ncbi:MAG: hypothetical protein ACKVQA_17235 [Burkholderiales bacterium]
MLAMIRVNRFLFAVFLYAAFTAGGHAQTRAPGDPEQKRRLIEQKIRLIETLVNSPAARSSAGTSDSEVSALVENSRRAVETAKAALAQNKLDEASQAADEALKSASSASRRLSAQGAGLPDSAQQKNFQDLSGQIAAYRASVAELTQDARLSGAAQSLLARMDVLTGESQALANSGRLGDANKKLAETYKLTVGEISRLRAGQEIVLSLKFDTPAEEFAYEQRRFNSNEIMVDMMINEGRAEGNRRKLADTFVSQGNKLKEQAGAHARSGNHKDAVSLMEQANDQLHRALQVLGVPAF